MEIAYQLMLQLLLPIDGIGEGRAQALLARNITFFNLAEMDPAIILAIVRQLGGPPPTEDDVRNWQEQAVQLQEIFGIISETMAAMDDERAHVIDNQVAVYTALIDDEVTANDLAGQPDLVTDKFLELFGAEDEDGPQDKFVDRSSLAGNQEA
ncbi:MAG: hypothetical protein R3293_28725, partial [Candidatus Promineifilaceae bacterium]|nr:hypothetical protein [Candidatus Promineifilaceae bacterium]